MTPPFDSFSARFWQSDLTVDEAVDGQEALDLLKDIAIR